MKLDRMFSELNIEMSSNIHLELLGVLEEIAADADEVFIFTYRKFVSYLTKSLNFPVNEDETYKEDPDLPMPITHETVALLYQHWMMYQYGWEKATVLS